MTPVSKRPSPSPPAGGVLYLVATPIGNLDDITLRALTVLREADLIACEDTRHTRKLLSHFQIATPLTSYYREKEVVKTGEIILALEAGKRVALVSDAGSPCLSDPGFVLVNEAQSRGLKVATVPGPSALVAAIGLSGMRAERFLFAGFPPARGAERRRALQSLAAQTCLLVFYESPHRLAATLADCLEVLGDRPAALCKELTKIHERCLRGTLSGLIRELTGELTRGEFVLLVAGAEEKLAPMGDADLAGLLAWHREEAGLSLKETVAKVAAELNLPRSQVYRAALAVWGK